MGITAWFSSSSPCKSYETNEQLFDGLRRMEDSAILCVQMKALHTVRKFVSQYRLPAEQADDILNQSTLILLQKIEDGNYQFQNHAPSTYLIEIARRIALMATRSQKNAPESLDKHHHLADPDMEADRKNREAMELVRHLLSRLGQPCEQIVRLQHIEGYSDEEVVSQKLTRYTSIDSLKVKRSDCMKKLIKLAQQWKTSNNT